MQYGRRRFAAGAAHQLVGGQAKLLSGKIVQRDVDGGEGMDAEPATAWPEGAFVHLLPERGDLDRILPDQNLRDIAAPHMRRGHGEELLHDAGRRIRLAEAVAPVLVDHLDDDRLDSSIAIVTRLVRRDDRNDFNSLNGGHRQFSLQLRKSTTL